MTLQDDGNISHKDAFQGRHAAIQHEVWKQDLRLTINIDVLKLTSGHPGICNGSKLLAAIDLKRGARGGVHMTCDTCEQNNSNVMYSTINGSNILMYVPAIASTLRAPT
eukprot:3684728-Amphidinium_carterae.1